MALFERNNPVVNDFTRLKLLFVELVEPGVVQEVLHRWPQILIFDQALLYEVYAFLRAVLEDFLFELRLLMQDCVVEAQA